MQDKALTEQNEASREAKIQFKKRYPKVNLNMFDFVVNMTPSGEVGETNIYYKFDKYGDSYDITSQAFETNKKWITQGLGLTFKQAAEFSYYGAENYSKFNNVLTKERWKLRAWFLNKYPHANINKFKFNVYLNRKTLAVERTSIFYKVSEKVGWDITSKTFKSKYSDVLYWSPRIWSTSGSVQTLIISTNPFLVYNRFKIYVSYATSFKCNFEKLNTTWTNTTNTNDITTVKFDLTDPYFASLFAAYIISYLGGVSFKHLTEDPKTPKIITSIARYYVYYHMKRFLRYPAKMNAYAEYIPFVQRKQQKLLTKKIWVNKLDNTQEKLSLWLKNKKEEVRNYHYEMSGDPAQGILGISYQEVDKVVNISDQDWIKFIKKDSDGLTKTGQKLFQHAIESYVYCVLGAQALTHWSIVNEGAKSLQSQEIFHKLVKDTIAQDDVSVSISNMRKAIKDTNVTLNMVISPGIILIPSDMIILKKKIPGYNNTLTLATADMKFGKNDNVNYSGVALKSNARLKPIAEEEEPPPNQALPSLSTLPSTFLLTKPSPPNQALPPTSEIYTFVLAIISGALISKYVL